MVGIDWAAEIDWIDDLIREFSNENEAVLTQVSQTRNAVDPSQMVETVVNYDVVAVPYDPVSGVLRFGADQLRRRELAGEYDRFVAVSVRTPNGTSLPTVPQLGNQIVFGGDATPWRVTTVSEAPNPSGFPLCWIVGISKLSGEAGG